MYIDQSDFSSLETKNKNGKQKTPHKTQQKFYTQNL